MSVKIKRQIHPLIRLDINTNTVRSSIIPNRDHPPTPNDKPPPLTKDAATQTDIPTLNDHDPRAEYIISSVLDKLPNVIKQAVDQKDEKSDTIHDNDIRPFLIIHSRDIELEEIELLKSYGSVFKWDPSFVNIPLSAHHFDYCLLDIHHKDVRMLLMKTDLSPYHIVIVSRIWESEDDFHEDIQAENVIHSFPPRQAFAGEFNRLLLIPKIRKPSCAKAILRFMLKILSGC